LTGYAKDVLDFVAFREQVLDVKSLESSDRTGKWAIEILDLDQKSKKVEIFDAVIVANDRYNDPYGGPGQKYKDYRLTVEIRSL
jgi:hypothetical protein